MPAPTDPADRGLRPDRRLQHHGPGRPQRLDRLAVLAAVRQRRLLRRLARLAGQRPLADRAPERRLPVTRHYRDGGWCWKRCSPRRTAAAALIDFMIPEAATPRSCASSRAAADGRLRHGPGASLRLRRRGAVGHPAGGAPRPARHRRARMRVLRTRSRLRAQTCAPAPSSPCRRRARPVRPGAWPVPPAARPPVDADAALASTERLLVRLVGQCTFKGRYADAVASRCGC